MRARPRRSPPTPGVPLGPNPRVGCVLLDPDGTAVAEGFHRGAGTPHAEVDALAAPATGPAGATAVVTLEPCNHTGRTGPCSAGAARRRGAPGWCSPRPTPARSRPAARPRCARPASTSRAACWPSEAAAVNRAWTFAVEHGRPFVTWKLADDARRPQRRRRRHAALDHRGPPAATSTGCAPSATRCWSAPAPSLADDPQLTVRDADDRDCRGPAAAAGGDGPAGAARGPPGPRRRRRDRACCATRDPAEALAALYARDVRHVLLEGGPTLAAAFVRGGLVDQVVAYVAPCCSAPGCSGVGDLGVTTIAEALAARRRRRHRARRPAPDTQRAAHPDPAEKEDRLMFTGIVEELGVVVASRTTATPSGWPCAGRS